MALGKRGSPYASHKQVYNHDNSISNSCDRNTIYVTNKKYEAKQ
jgi:hypothetical protein